MERGVLVGVEGALVPADRVHLCRDHLCRAVLRALEDHVLDEVADAALGGGLMAAAALQPHPHGHAAHVRHGFGEEGDAVRKDLLDDHRLVWKEPDVSMGTGAAQSGYPYPPGAISRVPTP